jgi:TrmH family RNA methyltransferase
MLTKNDIKFIRSLREKEVRMAQGVFVAEGEKLVADLLKRETTSVLIYTTEKCALPLPHAQKISISEMERITLFKTPSSALAVFKQPQKTFQETQYPALILDGVRNPGNLGTIIRLCDWFGIHTVWCTDDCADVYNEKAVQASMGSVVQISVKYASRHHIAEQAESMKMVLIGAGMDGENIYEANIPVRCALVMGNEGQGLSPEMQRAIKRSVAIPAAAGSRAESLNVALATAILLSEVTRRKAI